MNQLEPNTQPPPQGGKAVSVSNEELAAAVRDLAQEGLQLAYRANIIEQLALRLLAHLATTDPASATRIAGEVKQQALAMGNPRDNPLEADAQESMLELLNYVQKAGGRQSSL